MSNSTGWNKAYKGHGAGEWATCRETSSAAPTASLGTIRSHRQTQNVGILTHVLILPEYTWTHRVYTLKVHNTAQRETQPQKNKRKQQSLHVKTPAINRLVSLDLYSILFCTGGLWITIHQPNNRQEEQHRNRQNNYVNRERKKGGSFVHTLNHHMHTRSTIMQRIRSAPVWGNEK